MNPTPARLLTVKEVAAMLHCSVNWVYDHGDEIGCVRMGGLRRFREADVQAYIEQKRVKEANA